MSEPRSGVGEAGATGLRVETAGAVRTLILDRPARANAYDDAVLRSLEAEIERAESDTGLRALVITGSGERHFCAGADRDELDARSWKDVLDLRSARTFEALVHARLVTIAAINGVAVGGGFELAMACDIRIAVDHARFWLPEPELGLLPAAGGTWLLPRLVGPLHAKELILGGARWDVERALSAGFLSEVVPAGELEDAVGRWTGRIERRDPAALRFGKALVNRAASLGHGSSPDLTEQAILDSLRTRAGVDAPE